MGTRKRTLTEADRKAAAKLRELWADFQKKNPGITQEAAAHRAGMTQSAFSQFLLGRVPMHVRPVLKLAELFSVEPTEIRADLPDVIYRTGTSTAGTVQAKQPAPTPYQLSAAALEIARVFELLSPQNRETVRDLVFMFSAVDKYAPWLRRGRPKGESYDAFERRHEQNMEALITLAAQRLRKKTAKT